VSDDEILWEDPQPDARGRQGEKNPLWRERLLPLMDRPGTWARVAVYDSDKVARTRSSDLTKGKAPTPDGLWEFTARRLEDGRDAVYARYIGP
jgi:hypothetical protein